MKQNLNNILQLKPHFDAQIKNENVKAVDILTQNFQT